MDSEFSSRILTTSPDVSVSTNLGAWVNRKGLFSREETEDTFRDRKIPSVQKWKFSPNDAVALSKYDQMTILKERVFTTLGEWHSIDYNNKKAGRLALMTKIVEILQGQ